MTLKKIYSRTAERVSGYFFWERIVRRIYLTVLMSLLPMAVSALVMIPAEDPYQGRGLSNNSVIDIIEHNGAVWLATSRGVSFSYFNDSVWNIYDNTNGLLGRNISALYSSGETLWVAMNHVVEDNGESYVYSDGLAVTDDDGQIWDTIQVDNLEGPLEIIYDITGSDSAIFCADFVGGLVGSFDGGQNWKNIYASTLDSIYTYQLLTNRYFSAVADTLHQDSLVLWAGTAGGLMRYIWSPDYAELKSDFIFDIISADSFVYICGDSGITRLKFDSVAGTAYLPTYNTSFTTDGLPGIAVTTAFGFGDRLFAGTIDSIVYDSMDGYIRYDDGIGLAISEDDGESFNTMYTGLDDLLGSDRYVREFAAIDSSMLFTAARQAGLYMSQDSGDTWGKVYTVDPTVDDTTIANHRNIVNSVAAEGRDLWVGTDSGVVLIRFDETGAIDSRQNFVFPEDDTSGVRSYKVAVQHYVDTADNVDSIAVWSLNHPMDTAVGNYMTYYTTDSGATWYTPNFAPDGMTVSGFPFDTALYDIGFLNNLTYIAGNNVFAQSLDRVNWLTNPADDISDESQDPAVSFDGMMLNALALVGDTLYVGAEDGFAVSGPGIGGITWNIVLANHDPFKFDRRDRFAYPFLTGNFVNSMGIQELDFGESLIWAGTRPSDTAGQFNGISVSTIDGLSWETRLENVQCWNFDFYGPEVFVASTSGLLYSPDTGRTWDTLTISGTQITSVPPVPYTIDPETWVTAVRVIGDSLWVGTEGGAARIALAEIGSSGWDIMRVFDSSQVVYAFPVPFSHANDNQVFFRYPVEQDSRVTLEVYDFAMDLVKRVIDNEYRAAGFYNTDFWNGLNGKGERAAVGMYYFKVSYSTGDDLWGKLLIVP